MCKRTIKTLSHCYYDLKYHIVWTSKYRGKVLETPKIKQEVSRVINQICKWKQWEVIELNIQDDHIHIIILTPPRYSMSYVMQIIKGKSSAWMKKKVKNTDKLYDRGSLWARGYFVSSIGLDKHLIRRYVRYQYDKNQLEQPSLFNIFK